MSTWTKEPWPVKGESAAIYGHTRRLRALDDGSHVEMFQLTEHDYERARACVNLLAGLPTELILAASGATLPDVPYEKLLAQRDALGAALESYVCKFGNCGSVYIEARAALDMIDAPALDRVAMPEGR